ncbi:hypothetical protein HAX54_011615 [Datura stramonium]|uniref:Uncharacterized protein n=1 Tax=Datura stramonium TaxID=4076 RepID=A0ABS8TKA8_DATST|nr:hypothetical protein [Datura stramonium]
MKLKGKNVMVHKELDDEGHDVKFGNEQWKVIKGNLVIDREKKRSSLYMVYLPSEGVTVPDQKRNKIRFTKSRKPVRGFRGNGSTDSQPVEALARVTRQWVKRTSVPAVKVSPDDYLLIMESVVCSQSIPGFGSSCKWESVGTEDESGAVLVVTDVGAWGSFNGPSG